MSIHTPYQNTKLMSDMEPTFKTTLDCKDSYDSASPFGLTTMDDDFFQIEAAFALMYPTDHLGALSSTFLPSPDSIPSLLPDRLPLTQPTSASLESWNNQAICQTTLLRSPEVNAETTLEKPRQVTKTRPRGRPRKDLSRKETTPPPSDNVDRYRAKNRRASARCREKERSQAAALEDAFQEQNKRNLELKQTTAALREELYDLQMQALQHGGCCCEDVQGYNQRRAQSIAVAWDL
ncbi:hypothetical protein KCU77_g892, partial [Aureobasidium melanogenum]